jgi:23S rRNA pseudouridine1911/1915/1917 synthase
VPSEELTITVPPERAGERLDSYLASQITYTSRSQIRRAIDNGEITVDNRIVKPGHSIRPGEEIQIEMQATPPLEAAPEPIPLEIVFEDNEIIVINKPAGMVTHPGAGVASGTLANALVYHFTSIAHEPPRRGGSSRPGIVHRLDAGTSGLIVVAKTDLAHLRLAEQFQSRTIFKGYQAMVFGSLRANEGRIEAPIGRHPRNRIKMAVRPDGCGRQALTLYRVVERFDHFTLLDLQIKTGRTHQIRVHLAHLNHPIVADSVYDGGRAKTLKSTKLRGAITKLSRPFLHASQLSFDHPKTGERLEFKLPLPEDLQSFLEIARSSD